MRIHLEDYPAIDPMKRKYEETIVKCINSILASNVNNVAGSYSIHVQSGFRYRYVSIRFNDVQRSNLFRTMILCDGSIDIKPRCESKTFYKKYCKQLKEDNSFTLSVALDSMAVLENPTLPSFTKEEYICCGVKVSIDNVGAHNYYKNDIIYDLEIELQVRNEGID